jgi:predicted nucleic acid-binding protein
VRLYFDTAYVAKCYLNEPDATNVRQLARKAEGLYSSIWCIAELACVFQRHIREGSLQSASAIALRRLFLTDIRNGVWMLYPISERLLFRVVTLVAALPSSVYLRAGEAIHLASALESDFSEIWTNDRRLLAAAPHFGLDGRSL